MMLKVGKRDSERCIVVSLVEGRRYAKLSRLNASIHSSSTHIHTRTNFPSHVLASFVARTLGLDRSQVHAILSQVKAAKFG
jgi:hypothetical protein